MGGTGNFGYFLERSRELKSLCLKRRYPPKIFVMYIYKVVLHCVNWKLKHPAEYVAANLLLDAAQRFTELDKDLCKQMGKLCVPALIRFSKDSLFALEAVNLDDEELKWMSRRELLKKIFTILYNCIRYRFYSPHLKWALDHGFPLQNP